MCEHWEPGTHLKSQGLYMATQTSQTQASAVLLTLGGCTVKAGLRCLCIWMGMGPWRHLHRDSRTAWCVHRGRRGI